jgi:hypothetical protein
MQVLDGHISTFFNDTCVFIQCLLTLLLVPVIYCLTVVQCYSFCYSLFDFVIQYSYYQ